MTHRIIGLGLILVCLASFAEGVSGQVKDKKPADPRPTRETDPNLLSMEIYVLETLDALDINLKQLQFLEEIAGQTADKLGDRNKAKATPAYRKALLDYHAALVKKTKDT